MTCAVRLSGGAVTSRPHRNKCAAKYNNGIALNAENWTRVRVGRVNRTQCLATEHAALEARCGAPTRGRRRRGVALHDGLEIAHVSHRAGSCTVAQRLLAFQTPSRRISCVSAGEEPNNVTMSRYLYNHGHQAEILVPMLDDAVLAGEAPSVVHWRWRRTHWVSQVLKAVLPYTRISTASERPARPCPTYKPIGSGGGGRHWLRAPRTAELLRRAVARHCGLRERTVSADAARGLRRERVVVLLRGDTQQPALTALALASIDGVAPSEVVEGEAERRPFANLSALVGSLRRAMPGASVRVSVTSAKASICTQARWLHSASVVVSAHGAHLTNALWMRRGATLIEVMPWAMWSYEGYEGLFRAAGLAHERIRSERPPPDAPHWRHNVSNSSTVGDAVEPPLGRLEYDQSRCSRIQECRLFYRAHSALRFGEPELCRALRAHVPAARGLSSACHNLQQ